MRPEPGWAGIYALEAPAWHATAWSDRDSIDGGGSGPRGNCVRQSGQGEGKKMKRKKGLTVDGQKYSEYIRSKRWEEVKKRYRSSRMPQKCFGCGTDKNIHLHHRSYKRLGAEKLHDLVPLCQYCHSRTHEVVAGSGLPLYMAHKRLKRRKSPYAR